MLFFKKFVEIHAKLAKYSDALAEEGVAELRDLVEARSDLFQHLVWPHDAEAPTQ